MKGIRFKIECDCRLFTVQYRKLDLKCPEQSRAEQKRNTLRVRALTVCTAHLECDAQSTVFFCAPHIPM